MAARNLSAIARALPPSSPSNEVALANPLGGFGGSPFHPGPGSNNPLVGTYADWTGGRGGTGLPRDYSTFLAGMFGPLSPMQPMPIDQPPPGEDSPEPRRFIYPVSWNMPHGVPGDEGLKLAPFSALRSIAATYSVAQACVRTRITEVLGLDWDIVPTKEAEKKMRGDQKARREFDERRAPVKRFFNRPDPDAYFSFSAWLSAALNDVFVVDALSLYVQPPLRRGKGIGGSNLAALNLIDGTTIRPLLSIRGETPRPPNPAYQQYAYGVPRVDNMAIMSGDDVRGMQDAKGKQYRGDQMMYLPMVPQTNTPYGFPPVERALVPILSGLQRQQYQGAYFAEGSIPGAFLSVGNPDATPSQCRQLQDAINAMAGDPAWKHRVIVVPGGAKVDPMRPVPLSDGFDDLVMTQVCMAFDVMPMELGITPRSSTTTSPGAQNQMAKASENVNNRKALRPLLKNLREIFDFVIQYVIGYDDMTWHWEGLEEGEDEASSVETLLAEVKAGSLSIDEMRVIRGHQPWGLPITSEPVYMTATDVIPLASVDRKTGKPVGAAPPPGMGGPGGGAPPAGPNGKPGGGGGTPAHAGAAAALPPPPVSPSEAQAEHLASIPEPATPAHEDFDEVAERAERNARKAATAVEAAKARQAELVKVGPKGYEHGWKKVGPDTTAQRGVEGLLTEARNPVAQWRVDHTDEFAPLYDLEQGIMASAIPAKYRNIPPDRTVTLYRANEAHEDGIAPGDWVTMSRAYAEQHRDDVNRGEGSIAEVQVPARDVSWAETEIGTYDGTDYSEWFYLPRPEADSATKSVVVDEPPVDVPAALRELDLIRRRLNKGRGLDGWTYQHLPAAAVYQVGNDPTETGVDAARAIVKAEGRRQRRDELCAPLEGAIAAGLRVLADQVADGDLSTLGFVDRAVGLLRTGIETALDAGIAHAVGDRPTSTVKAAQPVGVEGLDPRFALYAGTAPAAYELGYGLATLGGAEDPDNIVVRWHPRPDACDLCAAREGEIFTVGGLPGWPGDGGFGPDAQVCEGGPNCRCTLSYETLPTLMRLAYGPLPKGEMPADTAAMREALAAGPAAVTALTDRIATARAEAQRPYLMRLIKDILTALARAVGMGRTKQAGGGDDLADEVYAYLLDHYPAKVLGWVHQAKWTDPDMVRLSDVDMLRRPGGRDPKKVEAIAEVVRSGKQLDPVVLVQTPGDERLQIADGYHRTLGRQHAGKKRVLAYVGTVDDERGPWDRAMHDAKLNKTTTVDLVKVGPKGYSHGWVKFEPGELVDEVHIGTHAVHAHDGDDGHVVITRGDGDTRHVLASLDPLNASMLADDIDSMVVEARDYDLDDDENFDDIIDHTAPHNDGTYVSYTADGTVHVMAGGKDDHPFEPDDADTLAQALRDMGEAAENAATERQDREEEERLEREEREQEEREKAEAWWEDVSDLYGNNALSMESPTVAIVEDVAWSGAGQTTVSVDEMGPLAAAIRSLHQRGDSLPEWEPDPDDDDDEPDAVDEIKVSDRLTLLLLADGDMVLDTYEANKTTWNTAVWRGNAVELADGLDALHAQILAAPKPVQKVAKCLTCGCDEPHNDHDDPANITVEELHAAAQAAGISVDEALANMLHTLRHEHGNPALTKGDGWMHQLRVARGEHGGEWTHSPGSIGQAVSDLAHAATGAVVNRERLAKAATSGERDRSPLHGGVVAETSMVTFRDGTRAVEKRLGAQEGFGYVHGTPERQADAEELAALVAGAVRVPAPAVLRTDPDKVLMSYVDGTVGADVSWRLEPDSFEVVKLANDTWLDTFGMSGQYDKLGHFAVVGPRPGEPVGDSGRPAPYAVVSDGDEAQRLARHFYEQAKSRDSEPPDRKQQGLRIGLLDLLIGNGDRNDGNWIQDEHGQIHAIDHAGAWNAMDDWPPYLDEYRDFGQEFVDDDANLKDHPLTPADMGRVRDRLAALEDEFDRLGHHDWWVWTMDRVGVLAEYATGTEDVIV